MATSEAHKRANNKYNKKTYDIIAFRIRKDSDIISASRLREAAEAADESLNTYILNAIADRMENEGMPLTDGSAND